MSQITAPVPQGAVVRLVPDSEERAIETLRTTLIKTIPTWITKLDDLTGEIEKRQAKLARTNESQDEEATLQPESMENRGSTEPLEDEDEPQAHAVASATANSLRLPLQEAGFLSPPSDQQSQSPSSLMGKTPSALQGWTMGVMAVAQAKADAAVHKHRRTNSIINAEGITTKYRTRTATIVYYDQFVPSFFDELVKFILTSGARIASARRLANKARIMQTVAGWDKDEDAGQEAKYGAGRRPSSAELEADTRIEAAETDTEDLRRLGYLCTRQGRLVAAPGGCSSKGDQQLNKLDEGLQSVKSVAEHAAHQFLRDGDCSNEIENIQQKLKEILELAEEMDRIKGEHGAGA